MCKRLLWALALPALALGASPALAWHHYYSPAMPVAPVGMSYGVAGVQSFAVPSAYAVPAMSYAAPAANFAVPASTFAVPAASFAVPASGFNLSASSLAMPVQSYSVAAPSQVVLTQAVAGGNAQAQATDLLTVIDTIRKITDALGGINLGSGGGGAGNSQLSAQVSKLAKTSADHEKRISAIEKQLKIQKPSTGGKSGLSKQSKPTSDAAPADQVPAQGVSNSGGTGDKEIQALIQAMQASQRAADAQRQAADAALPAIEFRIAVTQNSLDQLKTLRDQLKKASPPPPPGPGEVLPKPDEKKP